VNASFVTCCDGCDKCPPVVNIRRLCRKTWLIAGRLLWPSGSPTWRQTERHEEVLIVLLRHHQTVVQSSEAPLALARFNIWPGYARVPEAPCRNRHAGPWSGAAGPVDVHPKKSWRNLLRRGDKLVLICRERTERREKYERDSKTDEEPIHWIVRITQSAVAQLAAVCRRGSPKIIVCAANSSARTVPTKSMHF
jgi:hypothetical protein